MGQVQGANEEEVQTEAQPGCCSEQGARANAGRQGSLGGSLLQTPLSAGQTPKPEEVFKLHFLPSMSRCSCKQVVVEQTPVEGRPSSHSPVADCAGASGNPAAALR